MPSYKVYFFQTARGTSLVKEFMEEQNEEIYAKILRSIKLLRYGGPFLKPPDARKIDKNLYELRIRGKEAIRIFYTKTEDGYILLHAFKKKTQKIPKKELKIAIDRVKELV
ncbi:type II toxin-antitoxin system RelE/ParE family toxin [Candidatus Woesebacteria bacterium]|nr:type II toxin-antitoxin system RelE/ParE family toxin [Candidatus Woesebacteria bacterium]